MLFLTLRFMVFGFPSSYSIPAAPPSPDICSSFSRSSSSAWATDLRFAGCWLLFGSGSDAGDFLLMVLDFVESSSGSEFPVSSSHGIIYVDGLYTNLSWCMITVSSMIETENG